LFPAPANRAGKIGKLLLDKGEKLWVQRYGIKHGIARELLEAGVPKDRIVLAFRSPELRRSTDFAIP
jgi:hypothetical protein